MDGAGARIAIKLIQIVRRPTGQHGWDNLIWTQRKILTYPAIIAEKLLDKAYNARNADQTRDLYDAWAASYEAEVTANGYVTLGRCADALASCLSDQNAAILDFGCGTGLSGLALRKAGCTTLDGVDLSEEMLAGARGKGAYRALTQIEAGVPLPATPGAYAAVTAIGMIGVGAAPISVFDTLMAALAPGGLLVFSFNDHLLEEPENEARIQKAIETGEATQLVRDYGPHLTRLNLSSAVYVIEKLC